MSIINQQEVKNIVETINSIPDCRTLEIYAARILKRMIQQMIQALESSAFFAELSKIPTDIDSAIKWITTFINRYILGPYATLIELYAELLVDYALIAQAIENKLATISCQTPFNGASLMGSFSFGGSTFGG